MKGLYQWTQLWNQIYIWTKKLTTTDLQLNQAHLKNKWLIMQWLCPSGKFKLATVKNKEHSKKIPKNELTLHGNTSGTFLKIWDWMKITLLHSLSLTFRANRHLQSCLEVRVGFRCSFSFIKEGNFSPVQEKILHILSNRKTAWCMVLAGTWFAGTHRGFNLCHFPPSTSI